MQYQDPIWDEGMQVCIGHRLVMDRQQFIKAATNAYIELTGEKFERIKYTVTDQGLAWIMELEE